MRSGGRLVSCLGIPWKRGRFSAEKDQAVIESGLEAPTVELSALETRSEVFDTWHIISCAAVM